MNVPVTIGICVPPDLWGSCADYIPADADAFVPGCEPLPAAAQAPGPRVPLAMKRPHGSSQAR